MIRQLVCIVIVSFSFLACKNDPPNITDSVDVLAKEYELQPTVDKAKSYLSGVESLVEVASDQPDLVRPYLFQAVEVAEKNELYSRLPSFLLPLLRQNISDNQRSSLLPRLQSSLRRINKNHAADVLAIAMAKKSDVAGDTTTIEGYMNSLFQEILINPDETGVNKSAAMRFVDASEALALAMPDYPGVPDYLYKSGEVARSIRTLPKAMSLYDWVLEAYPNHPDAPKVLFIKGFLLEHEFKNPEDAQKIYEEFITKYPNHEMAESAKFLLKNIGKSEEEILKEILPKKQVN